MIFIIDDDKELSDVVAKNMKVFAKKQGKEISIRCFSDVIEAINATNEVRPSLVFLDILLNGPDGFTLLNEMQSYEDLAKVPIVIMSSLNFEIDKLLEYNVVKCLNKSLMTPEQIWDIVEEYE